MPPRFESADNNVLSGDRPLPEWAAWGEPSDFQVCGSSSNPFLDQDETNADIIRPVEHVTTALSTEPSI